MGTAESFNDKVVSITEVSLGMGHASSHALAERAAMLALVDIRPEEARPRAPSA